MDGVDDECMFELFFCGCYECGVECVIVVGCGVVLDCIG